MHLAQVYYLLNKTGETISGASFAGFVIHQQFGRDDASKVVYFFAAAVLLTFSLGSAVMAAFKSRVRDDKGLNLWIVVQLFLSELFLLPWVGPSNTPAPSSPVVWRDV